MACSVLIFGLLISVGGIHLVQSNTGLVNLAYGKRVTLSSNYNPPYPGANAVNGVLSDLAHTGAEDNPWLRIDLGAECSIHEIEIFARSDCCGSQLHDLEVSVGRSRSQMSVCGHFTGPAPSNGARVAIWCPYSTVGRYVEVKIVKDRNNVLTPAEVLVWGNPNCI